MTLRIKTMKFSTSAFNQIMNTTGTLPAESGGLILGSRDDFIVRKFLHDKNAKTTRTSYSFDIGYLNPLLNHCMEHEGMFLLGFLHSHPRGSKTLSQPDIDYFTSQFKNIPVDLFLTPIVSSVGDGEFDITPYVFYKDTLQCEKVNWAVIPDEDLAPIKLDVKTEATSKIQTVENTKTETEEKREIATVSKQAFLTDATLQQFKLTFEALNKAVMFAVLLMLMVILIQISQLLKHL